MTEVTPIPQPAWADAEPVPDAERARLPTRDDVMSEIYAHRREVMEREMHGGNDEEEPPAAPTPEPRRREAPAAALPEYRAIDIGSQRINVTQDDLLRLAQRAAQFPQVNAMLRHEATRQALDAVGREFPDIFADRSRSQLAALQLAQLRGEDAALGMYRPDVDAYREAARRTRKLVGGDAPDRRHVPGRRQPPAPREPSSHDIVAELRRARGQM